MLAIMEKGEVNRRIISETELCSWRHYYYSFWNPFFSWSTPFLKQPLWMLAGDVPSCQWLAEMGLGVEMGRGEGSRYKEPEPWPRSGKLVSRLGLTLKQLVFPLYPIFLISLSSVNHFCKNLDSLSSSRGTPKGKDFRKRLLAARGVKKRGIRQGP